MAAKKGSADQAPPSEVASAYKTYLYAASPKLTAADFAAGAPIPTDQVEKDIIILENKIAQYKKFGMPCDTEEKQLKTLNEWKTKVKGKHWPGGKPYKLCDHNHSTTTFQNAQGEVFEICAKCAKSWKAQQSNPGGWQLETVQPKKPDLPKLHYPPEFVKTLKANLPKHTGVVTVPVKKETQGVMLKVGRSEIDQQLIMRMGLLSNCNVTIHKMVGGGYFNEKFVCACKVCKGTEEFQDHVLVKTGANTLPNEIAEFCTKHRHDATAEEKTGRLFREE